MSEPTEPLQFEEALAELEALVQRMEAGSLSLEESLNAFERGVELTRQCQDALQEAELRVKALMRDGSERDLPATDEDGDAP